jgi:preprotein translocase subunit SecD
MSASRLVALVLMLAVVVIGGLWAAYVVLVANPNSNRGLHLVVAVDAAEIRAGGLEVLANRARGQLRDAKVGFSNLRVADGAVQVTLAKPEDADAAAKALRALGTDAEVGSSEPGKITITVPLSAQAQRLANAIGLTIDILGRRFDAAGVSVRRIEKQGEGRIHILLPNPADGPRAKDLIAKTGILSLHELHPSLTAQAAEGGPAPAGYRIYPSGQPQLPPFLLRVAPIVRGEELVDATAARDSQIGIPVITFRLNNQGAMKLGRFTQANIGRPLAIVIDGVVVSAPVVREPILGGTGQISGDFSPEEAQQLAIRLKSGALPAALAIIEERVVTSDQ